MRISRRSLLKLGAATAAVAAIPIRAARALVQAPLIEPAAFPLDCVDEVEQAMLAASRYLRERVFFRERVVGNIVSFPRVTVGMVQQINPDAPIISAGHYREPVAHVADYYSGDWCEAPLQFASNFKGEAGAALGGSINRAILSELTNIGNHEYVMHLGGGTIRPNDIYNAIYEHMAEYDVPLDDVTILPAPLPPWAPENMLAVAFSKYAVGAAVTRPGIYSTWHKDEARYFHTAHAGIGAKIIDPDGALMVMR